MWIWESPGWPRWPVPMIYASMWRIRSFWVASCESCGGWSGRSPAGRKDQPTETRPGAKWRSLTARGASAARLSPQAGVGVGSREPSDPRRRPQHRGYGQEPPARPSNLRRGMGPVRADHRRESRPLRTHPSSRVAVASVEQDLLGLRALPRRAPATGTPVDLPDLPHGPRQRPQRRQSHSRRRAGGETKRLWSPRKTATRCGGGR